MNTVEIVVNPYDCTAEVIINNQPISLYSELTKYLTEPFYTWCDKVLECISRELNDEFHIKIISGTIEAKLLEELAANHEDCISFQHESLAVDEPLINRMNQLAEVCKSENFPIKNKKFRINIWTDDIPIEFDTMEYPLCDVTVNIEPFNEETLCEKGNDEIHFIIVSTDEEAERACRKLQKWRVGAIILVANNGSRIKQCNDVFVCECLKNDVLQKLKSMFEFRWLGVYFHEIVSIAERQVSGNKAVLEKLQLLKIIVPLVRVTGPDEMEVQSTAPLEINSFPANAPVPELLYKVSDEQVLRCDGNQIEALSVGEAVVEVYAKTQSNPVAILQVKVFQQNKIERIELSEQHLIIGVNDKTRLSYEVYPSSADNLAELQWESTNTAVAMVDQKGNIEAVSPGDCSISLSTKNVKSSCSVSVKAKINKLVLSAKKLDLPIGKTAPLQVTYEPKEVINPQISFEISNEDVISYENGVIKAKGIGKAYITFYTEQREVSQSCEVIVSSTLYKKEKRNIPLRISVASLLLFFPLSGVNYSYLFLPFIGTVSGSLSFKKNQNKGASIVSTLINGVFFLLEFLHFIDLI